MKVSEYILRDLKNEGVKHAFVITGGVIAPLIDAFDSKKNLEYVCVNHEQAGAIAAEAYARVNKTLGVAIATSGPGATNLLTGIGCAYFDSIPTLYLTGQVQTHELTWKDGPRQLGFQEIDIVNMAKPITKYSAIVKDVKDVRYELEKAIYIAKSGRPGPVLLDLPMNVQREEVDWENLKGYIPDIKIIDREDLRTKIYETRELIEKAERPVIVLGAGIKLANAEKRTRNLVDILGIPVVTTWGGLDIIPYIHPLLVEGFGVSHNRAGNFAVQNSDLMISLGARLDSRETGARANTFARGAKKIVVDIDAGEMYKGSHLKEGLKIDVGINYDLNDFLDVFYETLEKKIPDFKDLSSWKNRIKDWKEKYPIVLPEYFNQKDKVNPYVFIDELSNRSKEGDIIITDAGGNLTWTMQAWKIKEGQKLFSAFGNSPMGYSLPASIGASFASNKGPVTCIIGDGGIKMNIQELETIANHNLPIKTFIINNHEYGMIKGFQDLLFESRYKATCCEGGLGNSDLLKVARGFDLKTVQINNHSEMHWKLKEIFDYKGPIVCSVELNNNEKVIPKLQFGRPIEDPAPFLEREEFRGNMIVPPIEDKK